MPKKRIKRVNHSSKGLSLFGKRISLSFSLLVLILILFSSSIITLDQDYSSGKTAVLGEDEENHETEDRDESGKKEEEQQREANKKAEEIRKEEVKKDENKSSQQNNSGNSQPTPRPFLNPPLRSTSESERNKKETEIETANGQKIKTKIEDNGVTKVEIEDGNLKIKYKLENGRLILKAENENGEEVDLPENELEDLHEEAENELENEGLDISTESGKIKLRRNNVSAVTNFPLSINPQTKELIVTTPNGQKVVAVLPDQAIANLLETNIFNTIDSTGSASADLLDENTKLEIRKNEMVYRIRGNKTERLLGLFPVDTKKDVFVSAETGNVVGEEKTILTNLIDLLSP